MITITALAPFPDGRCRVSFNSPAGRGRGEWMGEKTPPIGSECHVELRTEVVLKAGHVLAKEEEPRISIFQGATSIVGFAAGMDGSPGLVHGVVDPTFHLDLAVADGVHIPRPRLVRVSAPDLRLYDMGLKRCRPGQHHSPARITVLL